MVGPTPVDSAGDGTAPPLQHAVDRHPAPGRCRRLHSSELFGGDTEVEIIHGHAVYRLRLTLLGKLILTK